METKETNPFDIVQESKKRQAFKQKISEHDEQSNFVLWFRMVYKTIPIFAIPNGGRRSKFEALRLKEEGVLAGVPDLFIAAKNGIFIEMKARGGRVSAEQLNVMEKLRNNGYKAVVCYGAHEAIKYVKANIKL
jgi:hypothetical protein